MTRDEMIAALDAMMAHGACAALLLQHGDGGVFEELDALSKRGAEAIAALRDRTHAMTPKEMLQELQWVSTEIRTEYDTRHVYPRLDAVIAALSRPAPPDDLVALRHALWNLAGTIVAVCDGGNEEHARIACTDTSPLVGAAREAIARFGLSNTSAPAPVAPTDDLVTKLVAALQGFMDGECHCQEPETVAPCVQCVGRAALAALGSPAPAPVAPPTDGSVMVRVDPVYVEQMRGEGLAGPFSRITLDERGGVPTLLLTAEPKPTPDTAEWWRAVAQELGVEIHKLKLAAQSVPSDLVRISQPGHSVVRVSQPGQSPAPPAVAGGDAPPENDNDVCHCGHTRSAHCWTVGRHRCYQGRCQCWDFGRRQEGQ